MEWGNLFALQFKSWLDTMSQPLRIKEDSYDQMFIDKCTSIKEAKSNKETLAKAPKIIDEADSEKAKHAETAAELI